MIWHSSHIIDVLNELEVDDNYGLSNGVADIRLKTFGENVISNVEKPTFRKRFFEQLNNKLVYILAIIAILSFAISLIYGEKDLYSPLLIIGIVIINSLLSAYQLYKCDDALNALQSITNPTATVIRDGIELQINSHSLVPGDIVILKAGDYITADARLIETSNFRCNEATISGENIPVDKIAHTTVVDIAPINERVNMIFSGCSVVSGTAKAVIVETGLNTEIGHTATIIQQTGTDSMPVESVLKSTSKIANIFIIIICFIVFVIGLIQNLSSSAPFASITAKMLLNSVALAVAAIPEGLPAISTVVVALGIQRIIKDDIIIKKVKALEMLGKTTVICADKTGIITKNHMSLNKIYDGNSVIDVNSDNLSERASLLLRLANCCSTLENDSTEASIEKACLDFALMSKNDVENTYPRLSAIPFDSQRKTMTTINMINGRPVAIVKGAPEILVEKCIKCDIQKILKINDDMALDALRVICIAIKTLDEIPANPVAEEIEYDLQFVGLIGLYDPPRVETVEGIASCEHAGIKTIMITGDNLITATAVARRIGILKDGTLAITGAQLNNMSEEELAANISKYRVFARVSPEDKQRIISALKSAGEIVAITGDGIADADALAQADIGCAMGKYGTDVAKGNADIIIKNYNFACVVDAIRESRGLFGNIQKSVAYLLSCNIAELAVIILGMLIFGTPPLAAVLLLWMNLLTDAAPAISLSMLKAEEDVMYEKPITLSGRLFGKKYILDIVLNSVFITVTTLISFLIGFMSNLTLGMTMAFLTLGLSQILHSFNIKSQRSIFRVKLGINDFMTVSSFLIIFIMLFLVLTPAGFVFNLCILGFKELIISLALALAVIPFSEVCKFVKRTIK